MPTARQWRRRSPRRTPPPSSHDRELSGRSNACACGAAVRHDVVMTPSTETTQSRPVLGGTTHALEHDSRAVLGQTMGLVAVTLGFAAVGAALGKDLSAGAGMLA